MKRPYLKLLGLALALCLVLTGCNLIEVDEVMQLQENIQALEKANSRAVINYDGGEITKGDVMYEYAYQANYMYQLYSMYGITMQESTYADIRDSVLTTAMNTRASVLKAEELGITLTEEEEAECLTNAEDAYNEQYTDYVEDHATSKTEEGKQLEAEYALKQSGMTVDTLLYAERASKLIEKLQEQVKGEVSEVSEEDVQSAFELKAAEDEAKYETDRDTFESDMTSADVTPYWIPDGYRTVKHILLTPADEYMDAVTEAQALVDSLNADLDAILTADSSEAEDTEDAEAEETTETEEITETDDARIAELREEIASAEAAVEEAKAAAIASVQARIDEILSRYESGDSFDDLIAEYGEDPGMANEPTASRGYYVSDTTSTLDPVFKEAAMALENVGDISEPVLGSYGVHIIRYESDVPAGNVDLETVREALTAEVLEEKQDDYYDEQLEAWVSALNPVYTSEDWTAWE